MNKGSPFVNLRIRQRPYHAAGPSCQSLFSPHPGHPFIKSIKVRTYSFRSDFTGFASAAFTECQAMGASATSTATVPASTNTPGPTGTR